MSEHAIQKSARTKYKVYNGVLQHFKTFVLARVYVKRARNSVTSQTFDLVTNKINQFIVLY